MKMSSKRTANTDLNRDNWDDEVEPEEAGTFKKASLEELKNRVIRKAIRRKPSDTPAAPSVFTGFGGFKSTTTTDTKAPSFSFLSKLTGGQTAEKDKSSPQPPQPMFSFGSNKSGTTTAAADKKSTSDPIVISDDSKSNSSSASSKSSEYLSQLRSLNQSLLKWVTQHVTENPNCILTPIFNDYGEHLKKIQEIDEKKTPEIGTDKKSLSMFSGFGSLSSASTTSSLLSSVTFAKPLDSSPAATKSDLSSVFKSSASPSAASSSASDLPKNPFASSTATTSPGGKPLFSFDASKPFTFAASVAAPSQPANTNGGGTAGGEDEDDDEPPKNEFKQVVEEDSKFSKRCKVFVKKDNAFTERGIGTLHLKPVKDSNKTQLIVRADTNLGNILVNVLLTNGIPVQKMKNNVLIVCLPTPESKPPPTPVLLRVGDEKQADELLAEIKKCIPAEE